ncbi:hypothetical protein ACFU8W_46795 [Streptomyces sp. NPDC057565]
MLLLMQPGELAEIPGGLSRLMILRIEDQQSAEACKVNNPTAVSVSR